MPKKKLMADFVNHAKVPDEHKSAQIVYWDQGLPGFGLRVSRGGARTWVYAYRYAGKMRWMTLGIYPGLSLADARTAAHKARSEARSGDDPATEKKTALAAQAAQGVTFGELARVYLERHAKMKKKTWRQDERMLNHDVLPAWGGRPVADIKRADVVLLLDRIVDRGAGTQANRVQALISTIFNFVIGRGAVDENPAAKVARPGKEVRRDRVLKEDEIRSVWHALGDAAELERFAPIFRLGLLTGQREGEIVGMRWDEIDLEHGWWTIPGERTKNGLAQHVPLVGEVLSILNGIRADQYDSVFVFPGGRRGKPLMSLYKPMLRVKQLSGVVDFRYHDLRRTARTGWAEIGIEDSVAERLLNHKDRGVQAVYNRHRYDVEKRAALTRWDRRVREIVTTPGTRKLEREKVIQLHA